MQARTPTDQLRMLAVAASLAAGPLALHAQAPQAPQAPFTPAERAGETMPAFSAEDFIRTAAQGGQASVEAARLAIERGVAGPVRDYAQRLIGDHAKSHETLRELAVRRQLALPPEPTRTQRSQLTVLHEKQGDDFAFSFVSMFGVAANQAAVAEFRRAVRTGRDDEVVEFARAALPVLEDHLARAETLQVRLAKDR